MATIFNGNEFSQAVLSSLKQEIEDSNLKPHLVIIMVGQEPASKVYVEKKVQAAKETGVEAEVLEFPEDVPEYELIRQIKNLNESREVTGSIIQLPLPRFLNKEKILSSITPKKDVDGLTKGSPFWGATPLAVIEILKEAKIPLKGEHAVIVGRSQLVGRPLALLLLDEDATVTVVHSKTENLPTFTKQADILVSAVGKPHLITHQMVKKGAAVVDVGITRQKDKLIGDVDFEKVAKIASFITPVPGGVGPVTVAMLMSNLVKSARTNTN